MRRIRVLTLNIWGLAWPIARDVEARVDAVGAALGALELDVGAFQEVWSEASRDRLIRLGADAGLPHAWFPADGAGGLLILSRVPIERPRFSRYALAGLPEKVQHPDYWGDKGFAAVAVDFGAGPIAVVTTHLHAAYRARAEDIYIGHRTGQVVQLAAELASETLPVIALGDFNMRESLDEYAVWMGLTGCTDVAVALDRREPTILATNPYRASAASEERIDFIFQRGGAHASLAPRSIERVLDGAVSASAPETAFSDHAGLLAEFEIMPGGTPIPSAAPAAIALARRLLLEGRDAASRREADRFRSGGIGLGLTIGAALLGRTPRASRRRFLRGAAFAGAGLAGIFATANFSLTRFASPEELDAYDAALARLDSLSRDPTRLSTRFEFGIPSNPT